MTKHEQTIERYYTIGLAGHIDHGKTALTKALTHIDTDRLKEEKERNISIEPGFATFPLGKFQTSLIDVPGHERFIRQMIAGVAGIDLVILVVAADEGVMPQTKEHLEILAFLGIEKGIIAITKTSRVDEELKALVREEIGSLIEDTPFQQAEMVFVDSLDGTGLESLKAAIVRLLERIEPRNTDGDFRLPIDQVFTLHGQGTIVRGTVYEGTVKQGEQLILLPQNVTVKVRKLQVHHLEKYSATAGQRVAINISGVSHDRIHRGDVLVSSDRFRLTRMVDVSLTASNSMSVTAKQRMLVKFHSGTSEVMGKIVLFDRNELSKNENCLCQIQLEKSVALQRGDRFVLRRPSPFETIGGGWVIDPYGEKHRFGEQTISHLQRKQEADPEQRIIDVLNAQQILSLRKLAQIVSLDINQTKKMLAELMRSQQVIQLDSDSYTSKSVYDLVQCELTDEIQQFHQTYPMRFGINKNECVHTLRARPARLVEYMIEREIEHGRFNKHHQYISIASFEPSVPAKWNMQVNRLMNRLHSAGLTVRPFADYTEEEQLPVHMQSEIKHYLQQTDQVFALDEKHLISCIVFVEQANLLYQSTNGESFTLQQAKDSLNVTRKPLLLFLELLDQMRYTRRSDQEREWIKDTFEH